MSVVPRALVLRAPGINCERETAYACRLAGFETELVHINRLLREPERLLSYHFLVLPGGFSYGDDLGAGTLLAKNLTVHLGRQLQRFVEEGRPLLGICNGFQVLVRAGLLPHTDWRNLRQTASLTFNSSGRFECRWISLVTESSRCIFTRGIYRPLELPVAHGEGRFVIASAEQLEELRQHEQIALLYDGDGYPANPNGSQANVAGVCNPAGNVLGLMPHPERYVRALQHPQQRSPADGLLLFQNAFAYVCQLLGIEPPVVPAEGSEGSDENSRRRMWTARLDGEREGREQPGHLRTSATMSASTSGERGRTAAVAVVRREPAPTSLSYATSGVNIEAGEHAVELMKAAVRATHGPAVLAGVGAFAAAFRAEALKEMREPVLVATTDGVGTKTLLAVQMDRFSTIGYDLVNHCVNDLLTQGARPLFFMDYLATGRLDPEQAATIVASVAQACQEVGCALLGGETAEMPDMYVPGSFDLAGTLVGAVEAAERIDPATIRAGDVLLGLPSSGLHTNGYSLARRVFAAYPLETVFPELGEPLGEALLRPHRCYLSEIMRLRAGLGTALKGLAHITGGGFQGNVVRILPPGTQAVIETASWAVPPLFTLIARLGQINDAEMYRTFNMGLGMVLVVAQDQVDQALRLVPELVPIGEIREGEGVTLT
ncbi:MAG: phosphoribosylformylglycinamidine cyclo-ligase [Thermogemmatispora sp.]|uniref:phosphoribosylformylglycinamidine cyclo-ligase n=1 Tax=Thermogemmatispora sp. TaxID=1968838 RepID=UPI0026339CC1|nr:phosphoribosylformylglycinamidine cyclo-ligase [Thermogemmatispora sp.]MBX5455387.1 phosphoribosylformylglycinamidine cyclo-ligase [Thermogemmatispora sp.]